MSKDSLFCHSSVQQLPAVTPVTIDLVFVVFLFFCFFTRGVENTERKIIQLNKVIAREKGKKEQLENVRLHLKGKCFL